MLSRWFQRRADDSAPVAAPPPEAAPALSLNLIEAQRSQAVIDLAVAGGSRYQSTIRDIDAGAGLLIIDEVFPAPLAARPGQAMTVTLRWNARRESFVAHFAGPHRSGEEPGYALKLPADVGYAQRRAVFRLRLPSTCCAPASFTTPDRHRYDAAVLDISIAGLRLQTGSAVLLRCGDVLEEVRFELAGQFFACRAEVRYVNYHREGTELGARLVEVDMPQQRALARAIMQLERRQLKRAG